MADYWKSQPRKQCEFCKCWIADNKPSIAFHESGKRHKENVAKRLSEIGKKSAKDAKQQVNFNKEIKKMEEAALKAYLKDVQENADFTSQLVIEGLEQKQKAAEEAAEQQIEAKKARDAAKAREKVDLELKRKRVKDKAATTKWHEAKSDDGYTYYWHTDSNETKWHAPAEGYLTIAEQDILQEAEKSKAQAANFKPKGKNKSFPGKKRKSGESPSQTSFKKKVSESSTSKASTTSDAARTVMGPAPKPNPYGLWKAVETKIEEPVDWQLPIQQEQTETASLPVAQEKPKIKFQEKKISKLIDDESSSSQSSFVGFKKKANFRGNVRQRLDTDD